MNVPMPPNTTSDAELVAMGLKGRSEAFGVLVTRYNRTAYHVAFGFLGHREEALDVVQAAIMKALQSLGTLTQPERFGSWFLRIVKNAALDRSDQIRRRKTVSLEHEGAGSEPDPSDSLQTREEILGLQKVLTQLNSDQREVLSLRYGQNLDYSTIGDLLNIPVSTVRSRLYEARLILKDRLVTKSPENHR